MSLWLPLLAKLSVLLPPRRDVERFQLRCALEHGGSSQAAALPIHCVRSGRGGLTVFMGSLDIFFVCEVLVQVFCKNGVVSFLLSL